MCDLHDKKYYPKYKKWCDKYFYLPHRKESRGIGGIFFDYKMNNWEEDFEFTKNIGKCFLETYPLIIKKNIKKRILILVLIVLNVKKCHKYK